MHAPDPNWNQAFNAIEQALPQRHIVIKNAGDGGIFNQLIIIVALLLLSPFLFVNFLGDFKDISADKKLKDNYVVLEDAALRGDCKIRKFFSSCDLTIHHNGEDLEKKINFVGTVSENKEVEVIAQKDDPNNISTTIAVDSTTNRTILTIGFLIVSALTFAWGVIMALNLPKKGRIKKIMNDPVNQPWQFTAVDVDCSGECMEFTTNVDGKDKKLIVQIDKQQPILLSEMDDESHAWVLAIKAKNTNTALPLTTSLRNIDITATEKAQLQAEINRHFPN